MKKHLLSIIMVSMLLILALPMFAAGADDPIPLDSTYLEDNDYTLEKGSYQLKENILLSEGIEIKIGAVVTIDLNGYVLDRGLAKNETPMDNGCVIIVNSYAELTITDSNPDNVHTTDEDYKNLPKGGVITGGYNVQAGGGIVNYSDLYMTGGSIAGNKTCNHGGGVCNYINFEMTGGSITENKSVGTKGNQYLGGGGGIYNVGDITISGSAVISKNNAILNGGAIFNKDHAGILYLMKGCSITSNTADVKGGGIYNEGKVTLDGAEISKNKAAEGGGVFHKDNSFTMKSGSITGNESTGCGAGIFSYRMFEMTGGSITGNITNYCGGGVFNNGDFKVSGSPVINDNLCIITINEKEDTATKTYDSNVYISTEKITISDTLDKDALISVFPNSKDVRTVITSYDDDTVNQNFKSDDKEYGVSYEEPAEAGKKGTLVLIKREAPSVSFSSLKINDDKYDENEKSVTTRYTGQKAVITYPTAKTEDKKIVKCNIKWNEVWYDSDKKELSEAPTAIGTYYLTFQPDYEYSAYIDADKATDKIPVKIERAIPDFDEPTFAEEFIYDGLPHDLITELGATEDGTFIYTVKYNGEETGTEYENPLTSPQGTNAGEYTITYRIKGDSNHSDIKSDEWTVIISKAKAEGKQPEEVRATYTGEDIALVIEPASGNATGGSFEYSLDGYDYQFKVPTAKVAGSYDVYYRFVVDDPDNYEAPEPEIKGVLHSAIACKNQYAPESIKITFKKTTDYQYEAEVEVPAGETETEYSYDEGNTWSEINTLSVNAGETLTVYAKYAGDNNHNASPYVKATETAPEIPDEPGISASYEKTSDGKYLVTIAEIENGEYSFDGETFSDENTMEWDAGIGNSTYARIMEDETFYPSYIACEFLEVPAIPIAPFVSISFEKTGDGEYMAVINEIENAEYSFDGVNFSSVNSIDVEAGETVTGYARIAETEDTYASEVASASAAAPKEDKPEPDPEEDEDTSNTKYTPDYPLYIAPGSSGGSAAASEKGETADTEENESEPAESDADNSIAIVLTIDSNIATVNGEETILDAPATIMNDRTMLPARFVAEALGAEVEWIEETRTVIITLDDTVIVLTIDSNIATVNGEAVELDAPAVIMNERTMLPIRFIAESLGASVEWDDAARTVTIEK